ncbi:MAG: tetratricopeptide repeat-containing sensor histidine kinase [Balneola sp.]
MAKKIRVSKLLLILGIWLVMSANLYSNVFTDFQTFQSDTNKVKSMFSDIEHLLDVGDFTKAYQKLDSVDLLSEQFDYEYGLAFSGVKRAEILLIKKQIDSALTSINKVIDQFPDSKLRFNFYNTQAAAYNYKGQSKQAIESFRKGLNFIELLPPENRSRSIAAVHVNMAGAYHKLGDRSNTIKNYLEGLQFAESTKDSSFLTITLNNLGDTYNSYSEYERAEYYLKRAETIALQNNYKPDLLRIYLNLGNTFSNSEKYDEALKYYEQALALNKEVRPDTPPFQIIYNLGVLYSNKRQFTKAKDAFEESLQYCIELKIPQGLYFNYKGLGDLYEKFSQPYTAISWYQKALDVATDLDQNLYIVQLHEKLYLTYKSIGETAQALKSLENFKALSDSIAKKESDAALSELESEIELNRQTEINRLLEEKQGIQERQLILTRSLNIAAVVVIVIILVLLYVVFRSGTDRKKVNLVLNKQKEELEELNQTKDKLFAIVAHDLRSPMASLQGILYMINSSELSLQEVKDLVISLEPTLQKNINTLDDLLAWARKQMSGISLNPQDIDTKPIIDDVISKQLFEIDAKKLTISNKIPDQTIACVDLNAFKLIIRNLLSNSIKFTQSNGAIEFDCTEGNDSVTFTIKDTGIGIPEDLQDSIFKDKSKTRLGTNMELGNGFGLSLCKEFAHRMNGEIYFESEVNVGTTFFLTLPKSGQIKSDI